MVQQTTSMVNGVNVEQLVGTIEAVKQNPDLAKCQVRAETEWISGGHSRTKIQGFYAVGQGDTTRTQPFILEGDEPPVLLGANHGTNAVEAVLHALASCLAVGFVYNAAARGIRVESLTFKLEGDPSSALIIFSQKNDGGWSQSLDEARVKVEKELGITIPVVENVPENATAIRPAVELFIDRGANIILGSAFGYSDTFLELAKQYPNVAFINPAGTTNAANLQSIYGRTYESQYLCGMAAGAISKSGKLGFVAANPFGLVNWTVG